MMPWRVEKRPPARSMKPTPMAETTTPPAAHPWDGGVGPPLDVPQTGPPTPPPPEKPRNVDADVERAVLELLDLRSLLRLAATGRYWRARVYGHIRQGFSLDLSRLSSALLRSSRASCALWELLGRANQVFLPRPPDHDLETFVWSAFARGYRNERLLALGPIGTVSMRRTNPATLATFRLLRHLSMALPRRNPGGTGGAAFKKPLLHEYLKVLPSLAVLRFLELTVHANVEAEALCGAAFPPQLRSLRLGSLLSSHGLRRTEISSAQPALLAPGSLPHLRRLELRNFHLGLALWELPSAAPRLEALELWDSYPVVRSSEGTLGWRKLNLLHLRSLSLCGGGWVPWEGPVRVVPFGTELAAGLVEDLLGALSDATAASLEQVRVEGVRVGGSWRGLGRLRSLQSLVLADLFQCPEAKAMEEARECVGLRSIHLSLRREALEAADGASLRRFFGFFGGCVGLGRVTVDVPGGQDAAFLAALRDCLLGRGWVEEPWLRPSVRLQLLRNADDLPVHRRPEAGDSGGEEADSWRDAPLRPIHPLKGFWLREPQLFAALNDDFYGPPELCLYSQPPSRQAALRALRVALFPD